VYQRKFCQKKHKIFVGSSYRAGNITYQNFILILKLIIIPDIHRYIFILDFHFNTRNFKTYIYLATYVQHYLMCYTLVTLDILVSELRKYHQKGHTYIYLCICVCIVYFYCFMYIIPMYLEICTINPTWFFASINLISIICMFSGASELRSVCFTLLFTWLQEYLRIFRRSKISYSPTTKLRKIASTNASITLDVDSWSTRSPSVSTGVPRNCRTRTERWVWLNLFMHFKNLVSMLQIQFFF